MQQAGLSSGPLHHLTVLELCLESVTDHGQHMCEPEPVSIARAQWALRPGPGGDPATNFQFPYFTFYII